MNSCLFCSSLTKNKKYCNNKCQAKHKSFLAKIEKDKKKKWIKCKVCNKAVFTNAKKYCSKKCRYEDSYFKIFHWHLKENMEKNPNYIESHKKLYIKKNETTKKKYKEGEIKIWNKGLTKENNSILKNMAEKRTGENNPIFKVLNDPEKLKKYKENLSAALQKSEKTKRGRTLEEFYGFEKSIKIRKNLSEAAKKRLINGHKGHKHSEESKLKMSYATSKRISEGKFNTYTIPMKKFYNLLIELNLQNLFIKEYQLKYYAIDFASPSLKLAIEIDGDFWHCNPKFYPEGPKYKSQIKNLNIQKRKEKFISSQGWKLLRFWEDDINNNLEIIKQKLKNINYI